MAYANDSIISRIAWCQRQRAQARGDLEREEWHAEEEGLRDALLNRSHANQYAYCPPGVLERYQMGLQDGLTLIRAAAVVQDSGAFRH